MAKPLLIYDFYFNNVIIHPLPIKKRIAMPSKTKSSSKKSSSAKSTKTTAKNKTTPSLKTTITKSKTNPKAKTVKIVADFPHNDIASDQSMWKGIVALILGLVSLFISPIFVFAIPIAIVGLILGIWALRSRAKSLGIAGIITSLLGLLISIFIYLIFVQLSIQIIESIPSATPATNFSEVVLK
jgi:hypothetical protein